MSPMSGRYLSLAMFAGLVAIAFAQDGRMTKDEERTKFHPGIIRATPASERMAGYRQRLQLEAASPFEGVKWRPIGPTNNSGRVMAITSPKDNPQAVYVAYATGGLYRTEDDGITWTSLFDREAAFGIGDVAVSRDGKTIWVGSGEANSQRTSYAGMGMFKSTDSGKTWTHMGLEGTQHIGKVVIDPKDENTVWVASMGGLYSQDRDRGVYKTNDGGKTWRQMLFIDEFTGCIDLAVNPKNPKEIYAAMWDRDRRAWNFRESGKGSALYKSSDGGATWTKLGGLPTGNDAGRIGIALCESKPSTVYAYYDNQGDDQSFELQDERKPTGEITRNRFLLLDEASFVAADPKAMTTFLKATLPTSENPEDVIKAVKDGKLKVADVKAKIEKRFPDYFRGAMVADQMFRTDDGGKTWRETDTGRLGSMGGYYWGRAFVNPRDPEDVYVCNLLLLGSKDGGRSWKPRAREAHVDYHAVYFDPRNGQIWVGNDGGAYIVGQDDTIRHLNNLQVAQTTTLAVSTGSFYRVAVGMQDNGTQIGPGRSFILPNQVVTWDEIGGGDGSAVQIDPRNNGQIYVASQFGAFSALNEKTGERYGLRPTAPAGARLRWNWIAPLIISNFHNDIIYVGSQFVHRSFNQGRTFEVISPDLTKNRPQGDVPHSTIKDISESPIQFGLMIAGTDDGNVWMTPDGGVEWRAINTPVDKWVCRVIASKWDKKVMYVAQTGYREDDFKPYLWRSDDQGKTWKSIAGNLPMESINVVREDPTRADILYVGTDMGVFVTFDGGTNWVPLAGGLPHLPVHDLLVQPTAGDLVIATHARGAWVMPLKQVYGLTPELKATALKVLNVDVPRRANWEYQARPSYDVEDIKPQIAVDFWSQTAGKAVIRLKTKDGKVVVEKMVDAHVGYNSMSLDLLLSPSKVGPKVKGSKTDPLKDPYEDRRAKYVEAGSYVLQLEVGTANVTQDVSLAK